MKPMNGLEPNPTQKVAFFNAVAKRHFLGNQMAGQL